jgi:hypothetical protein
MRETDNRSSECSPSPPSVARRGHFLATALGLVTLSPLFAEYLLGNMTVTEIVGFPFLMGVYGCAALGIRETARCTGRGWPTIIILSAAFGLAMPGLIDQSLFNPHFDGWQFQEITPVPALGISAYNSLGFVVGHIIWSMGVPIAFVEALASRTGHRPWLGRRGLALTAVGFLSGAVVIFRDLLRLERFTASPAQLAGVAVTVVLLIVSAFLLFPGRGAVTVSGGRPAPRPGWAEAGSFVMSSLFIIRPENWTGGVLGGLALLAVAAIVVVRWSRRPGWGPRHRLALASGAGWTYVWLGFLVLGMTGQLSPVNVVGQVGLVAGFVALRVVAGRQVRRSAS